jgi:Uma2 family endonuclease
MNASVGSFPIVEKRDGSLTVADLLYDLGEIPPNRVRLKPAPGTVTFEQFIEINEHRSGAICEWVENTLVEKAVAFCESWLAFIIIGFFDDHLRAHDVGMCTAPDGVMKILPDVGRAPDISFISWARLPGRRPPPRSDKVPSVVPDLAVEVLSESNTPREMARKREEYFRAGVTLVWEIDPQTRSATVYTAVDEVQTVESNGTLDGGDVMPGFQLSLRAVFDRAERRA